MRVCVLTETYYPVTGGGETQARALAEGLSSAGHQTLVVTRRNDERLPRREHMGLVDVHRLPPVGAAHLKKWGLLLTTPAALWRLRREYDLIYVSGFRILGLPAVLAGTLLGKRCILKADSLGEMSGDFFKAGLARARLNVSSLPFRLFLKIRNAVLRKADAFVAISEEVAGELAANGIAPSKIRRIPNSVNTDLFRPAAKQQRVALRERFGIATEACVVIYTGRLVSYKGLPLLLRVWKEIAAQRPGAQLMLVGAGGLDIHNCEEALRQYVHSNQLAGSVRFTGSVEHVHDYLQAADIFAFPTENEAFGISLIEAMACGLAVVASSVGGVSDIVEHGQNGLLVPPADETQLQEALQRLLDNPALRRRLGLSARETVEEKYTTGSILRQYTRLFAREWR